MAESDYERGLKINQKCILIGKELQNAEMYASYGNYENAKKLLSACIEAMERLLEQTKDDENFQKALHDKV